MLTLLTRRVAILILALPFLQAPALFAQNWSRDWGDRRDDRREAYKRRDRGDLWRNNRNGRNPGTRYPRGSRGDYESAGQLGYSQGYHDGFEKGEEDYRKHRRPELSRHDRYRDADHGYKSRYGPKPAYRYGYREGFEEGYREAYGGRRRY